jgi:site-specific recombinase XerD
MKINFDSVLEDYVKKLKYLNYSERTIDIYSHYINKFLVTINKYPQHLSSTDFEQYLLNYNYSSISQQNQIINALKFLYDKVLNKKYKKVDFQRPRKEKTLPHIIDKDYLIEQISKIENIKHKAIISLAYSVGLRVSEVINLKIEDIDSKQMIINIRQAKGRKDRVVPLTLNILLLLREYFKQYRPKEYLFNGQFDLKYSTTSCNAIVKQYLGKDYHFHLLRHSCFTNLTDQGVDIRSIQKLAGHSSSKTTEIYCQVSKSNLQRLPLAI